MNRKRSRRNAKAVVYRKRLQNGLAGRMRRESKAVDADSKIAGGRLYQRDIPNMGEPTNP